MAEVPSFDQYFAAAQSAYPNADRKQVGALYREQFKQPDVLTQGPSRREYVSAAADLGVSERDADKLYDEVYNTQGVASDTSRGFKRGFANIGRTVGAIGSLLPDGPTPMGMARAAEREERQPLYPDGYFNRVIDFWRNVGQRNAPEVGAQAQVFDSQGFNPGEVLNAGYLAGGLAEVGTGMAPMFLAAPLGGAPAVAAGAGIAGAQEGLGGTYVDRRDEVGEAQALREGGMMAAGTAALNALPLGRMLSPSRGGFGQRAVTGLAEGTTELAEEPLEAMITGGDPVQALKDGAAVFPLAAIMGGAVSNGQGRTTPPVDPLEAMRPEPTQQQPEAENAPQAQDSESVDVIEQQIGDRYERMPSLFADAFAVDGEGAARAAEAETDIEAADQLLSIVRRDNANAPLPFEYAQAVVNEQTQGWDSGPQINVVQSMADLPVSVSESLKEVGDIAGARLGDQVFVVADNVKDAGAVRRVVAHEAVGHYGMERMLGDKFDALVEQVQGLKTRDGVIAQIARKVQDGYANLPEFDARTESSEIIAAMAERGSKHPLMDRIATQFREGLRRLGFNMKLSRRELYDMIARAAKSLEKPDATVMGESGPQAMKLFHGSPHKFDKFDISKLGTGEGVQMYGHGLYFAQNQDVAQNYSPRDYGIEKRMLDLQQRAMALEEYGAAEVWDSAMLHSTPAELREEYGDRSEPGVQEALDKAIELIQSSDSYLYEVNIPDEAVADMLDYDQDLDYSSPLIEEIEAVADDYGLDVSELADITGAPGSSYEGEPENGRSLYDWLSSSLGGDQQASEFLTEVGVPGAIFLDQDSRIDGEGTRNIVLFDDSLAEVRSRNDQPVAQAMKAEEAPADNVRPPLEVGGGRYSPTQWASFDDSQYETWTNLAQRQRQVIESQRRGTRSWSATQEKAMKDLGAGKITIDQLLERQVGSVANAEEMTAFKSLIKNQADEVRSLARQYTANRSDDLKVQLAGAQQKLALLQAPYLGYSSEIARSLNVMKQVAQEVGNVRELADIIDQSLSGQADFDQTAEILANGSDSQLSSQAHKSAKATLWDKFYEYWINSILSGPSTHAVNILSNGLYSGIVEQGARYLAGVTPGNDYKIRYANGRLFGMIDGALKGMKLARQAFATEQPQTGPSSKLEQDHQRAIGGRLGELIRLPGRALMAEDEFFKAVAYYGRLGERASMLAMQRGGSFREQYNDIIDNLDADQYADLKRDAWVDAEKMTFTTPLTGGMKDFNNVLARSKVGKLIVPFVRTPTNIFMTSLEYMPGLHHLSRTAKAGKRGELTDTEMAVMRGRYMLGGSIMAGLVSLAGQGLLSGQGPEDNNERKLLLQQGWQPYSLRVGDEWIRYNRFDPMGMLMGVTADMYDLSGAMTKGEYEEIPLMLLTSFMSNFGEKTYLSGVIDAAEALSDPQRYMGNWARRMASSMVPNALGQAVASRDPYVRDAQTALDAIRSRLPGEREKLARRLDFAGQPRENLYGMSPINSSEVKSDPLAATMLDLGVFKSTPGKRLRGVELTPEEREEYHGFVQQTIYQALTPMIQSPQFQQLKTENPEAAHYVLDRQYDQIRNAAQRAFEARLTMQGGWVERKAAERNKKPKGSRYSLEQSE